MTHADLTAAGIAVDAPAFQRLNTFVSALLDENSRLNLTGCREASELWRSHICDSLSLLPFLEPRPLRLLDLGAGGGLPGLPLACVRPDCEFVLLDATRKKVDALRRIADRIGLANARMHWGRAEEAAHQAEFREQFDIVAARAVAAAPILVELVAGFLRVGGAAWLFKSVQGAEAESRTAARAAETTGMRLSGLHEYGLPGNAGRRCYIQYVKTAVLGSGFPRSSQEIARKRL